MTNSWKNILIKADDRIRLALDVIDKEALRIALVVDNEQRLLGVVTDGDIRRGILRGVSLEQPVSEIMYQAPLVGTQSSSQVELRKKMEELDILSIPLVDDDNRVTGLLKFKELQHRDIYDNPVFLMAGGFGTRLKPLTNNCPKPLLKVGDKPILEVTLINFINSGFRNFYISTHYMPEMIQAHFGDGSKWGVNITYVHEESPLGTGGALGLLPEDLNSLPLIMINGDILTNMDFTKLLKFHNDECGDATMCVREYEYQVPYGVVNTKENCVMDMVEKPVHKFHVNAGIYIVNNDIINNVRKNHKIDMPTLLEERIKQNGKVLSYPVNDYWLDIGRMEDYQRAQADVQELGFHQ